MKPAARKSHELKDSGAYGIAIQIATRAKGVPPKSMLQRWALAALRSKAEVTLRVVGLNEGHELNRRYRHGDYATNVLSFSYENEKSTGEKTTRKNFTRGDVVLCAPVVSREARQQQKTLVAHYAHLTVHGLLHLQGFDHQTQAEARLMENREIRLLRDLGYANPYL
ncbi:MAG: rRNA maturation RNase YbeY [Burkholderiales bacterium]